MRGRTGGMALAAITSIVLVASACGGGGSEPQPGTSQAGAQGGEIAIRSCTPQNPLIPANTNEVCGGNCWMPSMRSWCTTTPTRLPRVGHRRVDRDQGQPDLHGETQAGLQVPRWNRGQGQELRRCLELERVRPEWQSKRLFLRTVAGYDDLQCGTDSKGNADCEGKPAKAKEMTGLKVVDDHTFTIKTTDKVSNLPVRLGYTAFAPLPDSFFSDPKAYGEKPIGAGPSSWTARPTPRWSSRSSPTTRANTSPTSTR